MDRKTLSDIEADATELASMVEGMDVLYTVAQGGRDCPEARQARNAIPAIIKATVEKAWNLSRQIEQAADSADD